MHDEARKRIALYLSASHSLDKKFFFTALNELINSAEKKDNFNIIRAIETIFSEKPTAESKLKCLVSSPKMDHKKFNILFSTMNRFGYSDAAKCLFDIILIYQCFLSSEIAMNIAETYPAFLSFIKQKSLSPLVLGEELVEPSTGVIVEHVKDNVLAELLQSPKSLSKTELLQQFGDLEARIERAMIATYWKESIETEVPGYPPDGELQKLRSD